jgi:hypothetical protein
MTFTAPLLIVIPLLIMIAGLIVFLTADPAKDRVVQVGKILFAIGLFFCLWYLQAHGVVK